MIFISNNGFEKFWMKTPCFKFHGKTIVERLTAVSLGTILLVTSVFCTSHQSFAQTSNTKIEKIESPKKSGEVETVRSRAELMFVPPRDTPELKQHEHGHVTWTKSPDCSVTFCWKGAIHFKNHEAIQIDILIQVILKRPSFTPFMRIKMQSDALKNYDWLVWAQSLGVATKSGHTTSGSSRRYNGIADQMDWPPSDFRRTVVEERLMERYYGFNGRYKTSLGLLLSIEIPDAVQDDIRRSIHLTYQ